jgi:hypothetical protein
VASVAGVVHEPLVRGAELGIGVVIACVLVGPAVVAGGLAGSAGAEVYGHAWVQSWAAAGWPGWPTGTALASGTAAWPVIDPLPTWILGGLARGIGATAAWNLWAFIGVVLAAVGGGAFARALGGYGIVGAVGVATMPIFLGSLTSGLTEDYALGLVALALAALVTGRRLLGAALLGGSAWCGLYLAWLGAWPALAIGLRHLRDRPLRWILAGLLAIGIAAPAAAPFRARLGGEGHRGGIVPARAEPLWALDPWRGADLASFGAPGKVSVGGAFVREHPVYLGYTTLGLAAAGGFHPAWLGVLACAAVAPGEHLSWAGQPLGVDNPALAAFHVLPFAARFNHHARVMLLGQLLLVVLAARGARRLGDRTRGWGLAVGSAFVLFAETAVVSPARVPLPVALDATPAIYAALTAFPEDLPVAVVGASGPGIHPQKVFFDQRAHGRRLLHNPNKPMDGRPGPGVIVVALGPAVARVTAERGAPDVVAVDGAAWGVE